MTDAIKKDLVFGEMPLSVRVLVIAGAAFVGPYLIVRAALENRKLRRQSHGS